MSLVDYPSSDDDVSEEEVRENKENEPQQQLPRDDSRPHTQLVVTSYQQPESSAPASAPSIQQLPDASMLLNSPVSSSNMLSGSDHSSRVAAAMAESSSRKRENAFASSVPRNKVPRGNLPHSKNVPDTVGGLLVPPQLRGRSNIVTEDVGKLFVKKQADPSPNSCVFRDTDSKSKVSYLSLNSCDHCWMLLKDAPKWLDERRKLKKKPSNRGKGTSLAPEFSSPSTSESLIDLVGDDVPNTESGKTERKNVPNTEFGKKERLPIRKDAPDADSGNMERLPIGNDVLNSDFWNTDTPPKRTDISNTGIGDLAQNRAR